MKRTRRRGSSGGVKGPHGLVRVCDRETEHRWLRGNVKGRIAQRHAVSGTARAEAATVERA